MTVSLWGITGALLALVWVVRMGEAAFGLRRIPNLTRPEWEQTTSAASLARVSIIVPARNEEQGIEPALASLLALDYPNCEIIAVDDRSTDCTGEILERLATGAGDRLRIIHVASLPPGWLGKVHAMWRASQEATGEWLFFTDADVVFRRDALRRALACAQQTGADHFVLLPTMLLNSWGERMVGGFLQCMLVFALGHSLWKVHDPKARDYVGVGAFNLIRRATLEAIGGLERLRMEVVEDLKLGKLVKQHGFAQRVALGKNLARLHWARGALGMVRNSTKNFFALLAYRWPYALAAALGLLIANVLPFVGVFAASGWSRLGYAIALACIAVAYAGMSRYSQVAPLYFFLHPVSSCLVAYSILRSTVLTLWRGGVVWRETKYPLEELRRGTV
jgi:glycosyltransferase involved in cell wall biosynthesis